jgi:hypothetical protein
MNLGACSSLARLVEQGFNTKDAESGKITEKNERSNMIPFSPQAVRPKLPCGSVLSVASVLRFVSSSCYCMIPAIESCIG